MMLNAAASLWQAGCEDNRPTTGGPGMPPFWIKRVHKSHSPNVFFGGGAAFCNFCGAISTTGLAGNLFKACRRVTGRPTPEGSISRLVRIRSGRVPVKGQQWPDGRDCNCVVAMKRFVTPSNLARSPIARCHEWSPPPAAPVRVNDDIQNEINRCINSIATKAAALDEQEWDQFDLSELTSAHPEGATVAQAIVNYLSSSKWEYHVDNLLEKSFPLEVKLSKLADNLEKAGIPILLQP